MGPCDVWDGKKGTRLNGNLCGIITILELGVIYLSKTHVHMHISFCVHRGWRAA